jgi:threonine/homoserine/homoserine lactone efflux protein
VIEFGRLITYLVTVLALFIAPGPSVVFVVSRGISLGRQAGLLAVLGNTLGLATQLAVIVAGPAGLFRGSHALSEALKLAGAAFLIYLGIRTVRARRAQAGDIGGDAVAPSPRRELIRQGWVVGLTNPKGLITFTSIAPSFITSSHGGQLTLGVAILGLAGVLAALLCDGAWALASGQARTWFARSPRRLERFNAVGGVAMIGFGIALAVIALS